MTTIASDNRESVIGLRACVATHRTTHRYQGCGREGKELQHPEEGAGSEACSMHVLLRHKAHSFVGWILYANLVA